MNNTLEELRNKRLNWVQANQENNFDDGIKRLLTELYPDNAHFIYELLQNAEDPEATVVSFNLSNTQVEFEHDGKRLFTLKDVESITSIGNSTKRDDPTSIGKFGVGFKAVFAYTNTPEIHSGDFHFRIQELVVPETKGVEHKGLDSGRTKFIFPFNHPKKSAEAAVDEIRKGLYELGDNTLLFLKSIRKIDYILPDGTGGSLERIDHKDGYIEIHNCHPNGSKTISHWLRFQKEVEITDDDGRAKNCRIAIAYSLVEEENKKKEGSIWKIAPLERGQVSIFFPAEKETSNLRFHLHAPFASTVARDSVRDSKANHRLRDKLAELAAESLLSIRDQGKLTVGFLAVLPNPADNVPAFYEPIRKTIVNAFKAEALTPTRSGGHAPAGTLYRGPARIAEVLSDDDLSLLTNFESPLWAANSSQQSQREDQFLDSLEIEEWGWEDVADIINCNKIINEDSNNELYEDEDGEDDYESDEDKQRRFLEAWISKKDDAWLMRFYALLSEAEESHEQYFNVDDLCIVRVFTNGEDKHVIPRQAFFPPNEDTFSHVDVLLVKPSVYCVGRSESRKRLAKSFLESNGVRAFDLPTLINLKLESYQACSNQITNDHHEDLKLFIDFWKTNTNNATIFTRYPFLAGKSSNNKPVFLKPSQLCLDTPYEKTGLDEAASVHEKISVWIEYNNKLDKYHRKDFVAFLKAVGVMTGLTIEKQYLHGNHKYYELTKDASVGRRSDYRIEEDYSIPRLERYIEIQSIPCAYLIWNALLKADSKVAKARYRPNSTYTIREADSQLVYHLKNHAWIPNKQGEFCKPQDMTKEDLRDDFLYDNRNGLLTAIGFGENARKRSEEYQTRNRKAQEFGFESAESAEEARKIAELLKENNLSAEELSAVLEQRNRPELPVQSVPNPERRQNSVLEHGENAPPKESVLRERSIQPGINQIAAEAKAYLRAKYTNSAGELVCQCCQNEMPFKIGDAYYFEAVQCVRNVNRQHFENRLALCPVCAAKYQHALTTDDNVIRQRLIQHEAHNKSPSVEISVTLVLIQTNYNLDKNLTYPICHRNHPPMALY